MEIGGRGEVGEWDDVAVSERMDHVATVDSIGWARWMPVEWAVGPTTQRLFSLLGNRKLKNSMNSRSRSGPLMERTVDSYFSMVTSQGACGTQLKYPLIR